MSTAGGTRLLTRPFRSPVSGGAGGGASGRSARRLLLVHSSVTRPRGRHRRNSRQKPNTTLFFVRTPAPWSSRR
ncbi:hypothetical protein EVAR_10002_1 [Eumeta japonica]|uniref:Uncharacterized protein n=1 Tax=Eumeta variegata TaxID=151549 RepID=A0A4C1TR04_EUMVA|nr:hypothetical protein EVAR_10002_1 [Eumeta japonica]